MCFRITLGLILITSLLAACSNEGPKKRSATPVKVEVASVDIGDIEKPLIMSGNLTFTADARISARVHGQVTSLSVRDGQFVKAGDILLSLDDTEIKDLADAAMAALKKNTAIMEFSKSEWEKNRDLFKTGSVSEIDFDRRVSEYHRAVALVEADKALLAKAQQDLLWTKVRSPIDGVLSNRWVEVGDWVSKGQKLFEISDYSKIYVKAFVSDKDLARLGSKENDETGQEAEIVIDALPEKKFTGKIGYVAPAADRGRVFEVRLYLDNPHMKLREGMFARARMVTERIPGVMRVPVTALLGKIRDNADNSVFVVGKNRKVVLTPIKIGTNDSVHAEVRNGLQKDDQVVVYGKEVLSTGRLVEPAALIGKDDKGRSS
jgi:RND family efflux transporter MFP subunit